MAVREFNGTTDELITSVGGASTFGYGTFAFLFRPGDTANTYTITGMHTSGATSGNQALQIAIGEGDLWWWERSDSSQHAVTSLTLTDDQWYLLVVRKDTGTQEPRYSLYDFTADTWTHADFGDTCVDTDNPTPTGEIRLSWQGGQNWNGRLAARAIWTNELPWSADASGDTALEAAGLELSLFNWIAALPSDLHRFTQGATADDVVDMAGNGADQISLAGTTVVTGDDPPGFDASFDYVRRITGLDNIKTAIGALNQGGNSIEYGAFAFFFREIDISNELRTLIEIIEDGVDFYGGIGEEAGDFYWYRDNAFDQATLDVIGVYNLEEWVLVVARKATGDSVPRLSFYRTSTGGWTHSDMGASVVDFRNVAEIDALLLGGDGFSNTAYYLAAGAAWYNSLGPSDAWTADATGDTAIENAGLETGLQNWLDASPDAGWRFDQQLPVSGGTTFIQDGFRYHEFTASDDLVVHQTVEVEWLNVAGGGGGGHTDNTIFAGGGGGAGGARGTDSAAGGEANKTLTPGTYPVTVGLGGAGSTTNAAGTDGGDSSFDGTTSDGGGGGGQQSTNGSPGGSGGGGGGDGVTTGGAGTTGQGNDGGGNPTGGREAGGGGGRSAVGGDSAGQGGVGGDGVSVWGGQYVIGGGGAGGTTFDSAGAASGGLGGGGDGAHSDDSTPATPGTDGTGGGGGGGAGETAVTNTPGEKGGDGIVVIRYPYSDPTDEVLDFTGNGADQTAVAGTTAAEVPPPGFDFTLDTGEVLLAGDGDAAADGTGSLTHTDNQLVGEGDSASDGTGSLGVTRPIEGTGDAASDAEGLFRFTVTYEGTGDAAADGTGSLGITRFVAGEGDAAADSTGDAVVDRALVSDADSAADGTADLTVVMPAQVLLRGTGNAAADGTATLSPTVGYFGDGDSASDGTGTLSLTVGLVGAGDAADGTFASLRVPALISLEGFGDAAHDALDADPAVGVLLQPVDIRPRRGSLLSRALPVRWRDGF